MIDDPRPLLMIEDCTLAEIVRDSGMRECRGLWFLRPKTLILPRQDAHNDGPFRTHSH
jgi:hypothetical protein